MEAVKPVSDPAMVIMVMNYSSEWVLSVLTVVDLRTASLIIVHSANLPSRGHWRGDLEGGECWGMMMGGARNIAMILERGPWRRWDRTLAVTMPKLEVFHIQICRSPKSVEHLDRGVPMTTEK
jgi:hypothetical protein